MALMMDRLDMAILMERWDMNVMMKVGTWLY